MNLTACCVFCTLMCGIIYFTKRLDNTISGILSLVLSVFLFAAALNYFKQPIEYINRIAEGTQYQKYLPYMIKSLLVGLICKGCGEVCSALGENGVGGIIEGAGKLSIVIICLPLLEEIFNTSKGYIS